MCPKMHLRSALRPPCSVPPDSLADEERDRCPLLKNPYPTIAILPRISGLLTLVVNATPLSQDYTYRLNNNNSSDWFVKLTRQ